MKRRFKTLLFALVAMAMPLVASAQTKVEIDGIWYNLTADTHEAEVTSSDGDLYSGSITLTATVTYDDVAYSVTSIGNEAFYACSNLTAITIPEGVTSIGEWAFYACSNLTAITIPEGVTSIGVGAFSVCSSLTAITIPASVTSIGDRAFNGCTSLAAIVVAKGNKVYDSRGDCNAIVETNSNTLIQGCATTIIPEGVTSIGDYAFNGCSSLTAITLPESVTSIGDYAFFSCTSLTDVYCNAEEIPYTYTEAFYKSNIENATLHVPASAMDKYKNTAPWSSFRTIEAIPEKCATPTISYTDGKVVLTCATEGAKVITTVANGDDEIFEVFDFELIPTYTITAYASKEYYENSNEVTLTICWVPCDENHEGGTTDILTIPAKPVLISTQGGTITLSGLAEGTEVAVFTANGTELATATATDGTATLTTDLTAGTIAIVKTGDYSIKVAIK